VNELLIRLGERVHELRAAKKWSQEEFAHISGLHRTYIGQIERGEKNISFSNLSRVSSVLGVTLSELLLGLEDGDALAKDSKRKAPSGRARDEARRIREIEKLVRRLSVQRSAMDRTMQVLEDLAAGGRRTSKLSPGRPPASRARASEK
jgi:transcriptional regulator with XRE-family HTH domain